MRLQRLGGRAWLAVPEPPTTAWPKLKQFFADNGVGFDYEDTSQGRLNTVWLTLDADRYRDIVRASLVEAKQEDALSAGKDRLLIRVEQGLQPTATEVHVRHENDLQGAPAADDSALLNDLSSDSSAAESKLLSEIGAYIAARVAESTVSRVALEIGSGAKTELVRNEAGQPVLRLFLDRGRAWATLGQSLRNAEVVEVSVIEQNSDDASLAIAIPQDLFAGKSGRWIVVSTDIFLWTWQQRSQRHAKDDRGLGARTFSMFWFLMAMAHWLTTNWRNKFCVNREYAA